ncbi:MAG: type I glyceraldehyde-3-phosphate dehydrogenase, partial [Candidatus Electrothrix sp. AUS4]|nr:type I glyceraldehyde-3-phosphate dehydrogenase [Candidatus Electrothrix sp. AUS4]
MSVRIGLNGFGRIGRNIFRALSEDEAFADIEVVGINDLTDNKTIAHLLKYDSVMGVSRADIKSSDQGISVDGQEIPVTSHRKPADIPWKEMGAEYVLECTGLFRDLETAGAHIDAGASKVIISAPAKGGVKTFVMGVNEDEYDPTEHHIVSNASCTTNCLAPVAQVILNNFGIKQGLMTTVHAYTGDQRLLDFPHSDLRRARAAAMSM